MDWFTVLFAVLFVVLPLLQQMLRKEEEPPELRPDSAPEPQPAAKEPRASSTESWSDDWGEWPDASDEELVETLPEEAFSHEMRVPEAIRVEAPVVSMESPLVDHSPERTRLPHKQAPRLKPKRMPRRTNPALYQSLHGAEELRRAFVLSEIIGPPRALKPHADPE